MTNPLPHLWSAVRGSGLWLAMLLLPLAGLQAQGVDALLASGDSLLHLEKPQRAMEVFDRAIALGPNAKALLGRSKAWYMMDRMDRFLLDVESALRLDSTLAEANYQRGLYAMRANEHARAEWFATKAIANAPDSLLRSKAHILRGEARAEMKRYAAAIEDLGHGINGGASDGDAMRTLSRLLDLNGRHQESLTVLERLCELEPDDVGHWSNRGFELIMLERYDEAMVMIEKALAAVPGAWASSHTPAATPAVSNAGTSTLSKVRASLSPGVAASPSALLTRLMPWIASVVSAPILMMMPGKLAMTVPTCTGCSW